MKTQEEKLRHVMEASGECWHVRKHPRTFEQCNKCAAILGPYEGKDNPSPDDLNELFRLAEKLGFNHSIVSNLKRKDSKKYLVGVWNVERSYSHASNPAEALLNALFIATGGKE